MASNKETLVNLRNSVISNSSNLGWSSNHQIYIRMGTNQGYSAMFGSNLLRSSLEDLLICRSSSSHTHSAAAAIALKFHQKHEQRQNLRQNETHYENVTH